MRRNPRALVKEGLAPPALTRLYRRRTLLRELRLSDAERELLAPNAAFNGAYAGRRCFVVCNGPSLAKQDLRPLAGEVTITMNWFNKHPILAHWQPTVHCAAEPPEGVDPEMLAAMLQGLDAQAYFFHIGTRTHFSDPRFRDLEKIHYVRSRGTAQEWLDFDTSLDLAATLPTTEESSQLGLQLALCLGCSPIYLLGADQDWLSHRSIYQHFYPEEEAQGLEDMSLVAYDEMIRSALRVWTSHKALRELAMRRGQRILNATEGGFMDVYPQTTLAVALASDPD